MPLTANRKWTRLLQAGLLLAALSSGLRAFQVTPARQEAVLSVGESADGQVEVFNNTSSTLTIQVSAKNWFVLNENKHIGIEDWLAPGKTGFVLAPGQTEQVPFSVTVPTGTAKGPAPEGILVGMLSFNSQGPNKGMVNLTISVSVYAVIRGTEKVEAQVQDLTLKRYENHLQAVATIKNNGNVHLRPVGYVDIYNAKGRKVDTILLSEGRPIYPGRTYVQMGHIQWPAHWKNGAYRAVARLQIWDKPVEQTYFFQIRKRSLVEPLSEKKLKQLQRRFEKMEKKSGPQGDRNAKRP